MTYTPKPVSYTQRYYCRICPEEIKVLGDKRNPTSGLCEDCRKAYLQGLRAGRKEAKKNA